MDNAVEFISPKETARRVNLSRTTLNNLVRRDQVPAPIRLTDFRIAWVASEVDAWKNERVANGRREKNSTARTEKAAET